MVVQMRVDVGRGAEVAVPEPFLNLLHGNAFRQQQACAAVPLRYNKDKRKKPSVFKGFSVCRCLFNSFSNLDSQRKICRMMGGVT